jgi:hypothetical protein
MEEKLFYECSPRPFFVPPRLHSYREQVGLLEVIEHRRRSAVLPYGLRMEGQVTTQQEAARSHTEALQLARDLNIVWAYVAAVPLFPKRMMIRLSESPDGWRSNFKKIKSTRPTKPRSALAISSPPGPPTGFAVSIKIIPGKYKVVLPFMPLQRALVAVRAYRTAKENMKFLMNLHFGAIDQVGMGSQLVLLAKALDLARGMLPGHANADKQAALPVVVRAELSQSLKWLGKMSNKRLETRHVANNGKLLSKMSPAEGRDFVHDADLVIRGVVERELGITAITKW